MDFFFLSPFLCPLVLFGAVPSPISFARTAFLSFSTQRIVFLSLNTRLPCYRLFCSTSFQLHMHSLPFARIGSPPFIFIHRPRRTLPKFFFTSSFSSVLFSFSTCALVFLSILQPFRLSFFLRLTMLGPPFCPSATFTRTFLHFLGSSPPCFIHLLTLCSHAPYVFSPPSFSTLLLFLSAYV